MLRIKLTLIHSEQFYFPSIISSLRDSQLLFSEGVCMTDMIGKKCQFGFETNQPDWISFPSPPPQPATLIRIDGAWLQARSLSAQKHDGYGHAF